MARIIMPRNETAETVKLLLSWDIKPDHEQDYFEFVVRILRKMPNKIMKYRKELEQAF